MAQRRTKLIFAASIVALATLAGSSLLGMRAAYGADGSDNGHQSVSVQQAIAGMKAKDPVVWDYSSQAVQDAHNALADNQVRESPFYTVTVGNVGSSRMKKSFTYLSIPRGGLGKVGYSGEDGAEYSADHGFTMSWSSFVYSHDVWVNVRLNNDKEIKSVNDVTIRPSHLILEKKVIDTHTIAVKIPYSSDGYRLSVEFASQQHTVREDWGKLSDKGVKINTEPKNSMMIFAQPEVEGTAEGRATIPTETSGKIQYIDPNAAFPVIKNDTEIVYLKKGVHWMGAKRQADFPASVRWVYFEPGAYLKGALNFAENTNITNYKVTGYGVLSTEQYGYETDINNNFNHRVAKNCHASCVKPLFFRSADTQQTLDLQGVTVKEPTYHSFVVYGHEDSFVENVRNYQQVGAWYYQTDALELYKGSTMKNVFFHSNDDTLKLYHANLTVNNAVIWKGGNGSVVQWGWDRHNIDNVVAQNVDVIHSRMYMSWASNTCVFNSSNFYGGIPEHDTSSDQIVVQNMTFRNFHVEGAANCAIRLTAQNLTKHITIDGLYIDKWTDQDYNGVGSWIKMQNNKEGKTATFGDDTEGSGLTIKNFFVGGEGISSDDENWAHDKLGRLNFDARFYKKWNVTYDRPNGGDVNATPEVSIDNFSDGQTVGNHDVRLGLSERNAKTIAVDVNGTSFEVKNENGKKVSYIHLDRAHNTIRVVAQGYSGKRTVKYLSLLAPTASVTRVGSMSDARNDDHGPGSYVYPTNDAFKSGDFDMIDFDVYEDSDSYYFLTKVARDVSNLWYGDGFSTQQVHIYLRDAQARDTDTVPLRAGTNTYVRGGWKYAIVADGRFNAGVYTPTGHKVSDIQVDAIGDRIIARVAKSAVGYMNVKDARYQVSMYSSAEEKEGVNNIRPIYSKQCWERKTNACSADWIQGYRFGGAKGGIRAKLHILLTHLHPMLSISSLALRQLTVLKHKLLALIRIRTSCLTLLWLHNAYSTSLNKKYAIFA